MSKVSGSRVLTSPQTLAPRALTEDKVSKRVILFGGTFNPPHVGHLTMAQLALEQLAADELWFLPSPMPPHKQAMAECGLDYNVRAEMVDALIADIPRMKRCQIEESLPKPSYTVDTVLACQQEYSAYQFTFLMGSDSLAQLTSWHCAEDLVRLIPFVVAARYDYPLSEALSQIQARLPAIQVQLLKMPILDVSSTWIRKRLLNSQSVCELVPRRVLNVWRRESGATL